MSLEQFLKDHPDLEVVIESTVKDHGASWKTHTHINHWEVVDELDMYGNPTGEKVILLTKKHIYDSNNAREEFVRRYKEFVKSKGTIGY